LQVIPLASANIIGMLSYSWLTPIMHLGYQRTLQATDLWRLDERRTSAVLSAKLDAAWARRCAAADEYNARLTAGQIKPSLWTKWKWAMNPRGGNTMEKEKQWREKDGRKEPSLAWSLNEVFGFEFWSAGLFKVGDM
jgi:ATP-binding cassette subfamily C (CFTR/MRP) protein 1